MKALKVSHGFYKVADGSKRYKVYKLIGPCWLIVNHRECVVRPDGVVGRRVLAAVAGVR